MSPENQLNFKYRTSKYITMSPKPRSFLMYIQVSLVPTYFSDHEAISLQIT